MKVIINNIERNLTTNRLEYRDVLRLVNIDFHSTDRLPKVTYVVKIGNQLINGKIIK